MVRDTDADLLALGLDELRNLLGRLENESIGAWDEPLDNSIGAVANRGETRNLTEVRTQEGEGFVLTNSALDPVDLLDRFLVEERTTETVNRPRG